MTILRGECLSINTDNILYVEKKRKNCFCLFTSSMYSITVCYGGGNGKREDGNTSWWVDDTLYIEIYKTFFDLHKDSKGYDSYIEYLNNAN